MLKNYRVLDIVVEYYTKCYIVKELKYLWKGNEKPEDIWMLARLMEKSGSIHGTGGSRGR